MGVCVCCRLLAMNQINDGGRRKERKKDEGAKMIAWQYKNLPGYGCHRRIK